MLVNLDIRRPFHLATAQFQYLMVIGRDVVLSTLCHSCGFACQQRVLKTFPGPGHLRSEDGVWSDYDIIGKFGYICMYYMY